jgi:hypothetical protein
MGGITRSTNSSSSGLQDGECSTGQHSGSSASWALQLASLLCNCVYECNLPLLRRLLRAGAPVDIGDYDKRTALHISAAEGNAVMVSVLPCRMLFEIWFDQRCACVSTATKL